MKGDSFVPDPTKVVNACCAVAENLGPFEIYPGGPAAVARPATVTIQGREHEMILGFRRCTVCSARHFFSYKKTDDDPQPPVA